MTDAPSLHVVVLFGTRPEAIKLAPVIFELQRRSARTTVIATGQHAEMVTQVTELFGIQVDRDLMLMRHGAGLDHILSRVLAGVGALLQDWRPDALVIQGDTTSTLAAALAAFHARVPVAHVEAGLRSGNMELPFPEEMNRRVVTLVARWNFAPTERAAANLRREGVAAGVEVTGNTVVDALRYILDLPRADILGVGVAKPYILATAHRRESWGTPIERIARALARILDARPELSVVFATHPNPRAREPVTRVLGGRERVSVVDAMEYRSFLTLLQGATLAISDSGGVQEEGPTLGVPVLVTREVTERPEGVLSGAARLVGTDEELIVREALGVLEHPDERARMAAAGRSVYGDGRAAARIVDTILRDLAVSHGLHRREHRRSAAGPAGPSGGGRP